jgi:D-alanyl-D-alanine carboxypeptidase
VRQLLRHQSGLPEYFDDETPPPVEPTTGDQLLDMALTRPAQFPPGTAMKYTNTNYIAAALVIEKVTGRPAVDEITRRTIAPLGLSDTYFPAPGDTGLRPPFAHGYEVEDGRRTDVTGVTAWGHGGAIEGYHSFVAKPFGGPAVSMTFTQSPDASSPASDPRGDVMSALYCRA